MLNLASGFYECVEVQVPVVGWRHRGQIEKYDSEAIIGEFLTLVI